MVIRVTIGNIEPKLEKLMDGALDLLYGVIRTEAIARWERRAVIGQ